MTLALLSLLAPADATAGNTILVADSERVMLQQNTTVPASGVASNLHVPRRTSVSFDFTVEAGKRLLLVVLTEEQWQQASASEPVTGEPLLRVTISDRGTQTVTLQPGNYVVALLAQDNAQSTRVVLRARGRFI